MSFFLVTILNCNQFAAVVNRVRRVSVLTSHQKEEVIEEIKKVSPTCKIKIMP
jgi:hypothetical protein